MPKFTQYQPNTEQSVSGFSQYELPEEVESESIPIHPFPGGAVLKGGDFKSPNYVIEQKGWKLADDGLSEFNQGLLVANGLSIVNRRTSGEAYSANDALYLKKSDGRVYKATAAASDEKIFNFIGFGKNQSSASGASVQVYESGYIPGFTGLTTGSWYFVTDTAGGISTTPGTYFKRVGLAMSSTELYLIRDNLRVAQADGTFAITNVGANPGSTTITTGFRPSFILARLGYKNNAASAPAFSDATNTVVFSRITYFASWFSGSHRGFSVDIGGGTGVITGITTALFTDTSAGQGNGSLKIASLTDTGFNITHTNDGDNVDNGSRWEVIAIA